MIKYLQNKTNILFRRIIFLTLLYEIKLYSVDSIHEFSVSTIFPNEFVITMPRIFSFNWIVINICSFDTY